MFWKTVSTKKVTVSKIPTDLIKKYEGCELTAYKCPAGKWTIGYGTTIYEDGTPVKEGDKITQARAEQLLDAYLNSEVYPRLSGVTLTDNQKQALASLIYNIGWSAFSKSQCWKAIKAQDWPEVFYNWDWIKANRKPMKGLIKRRAEELALFTKDI